METALLTIYSIVKNSALFSASRAITPLTISLITSRITSTHIAHLASSYIIRPISPIPLAYKVYLTV